MRPHAARRYNEETEDLPTATFYSVIFDTVPYTIQSDIYNAA
jgi:hypothetical protein